MPADDQSNTDFLAFNQQVNRIDRNFLPNFFVFVEIRGIRC